MLAGYSCCGLLLAREPTIDSGLARRRGLGGGLVVGATWIVIVTIPGLEFARPILFEALVVVPFGLGARLARTTGTRGSAIRSGLWVGLTGGLLIFMIVPTVIYRDPRPYDPGTIHDFVTSGSHDMQTFAMADDFGGALVMLLLVPTVGVAFAAFGAAVASRRRRRRPAPDRHDAA